MSRFIPILVMVLFFYLALIYYVAKRSYQTLRLNRWIHPGLFGGIFLLLSIAMILARLSLPRSLKLLFQLLGGYWMGLFIYLFLGFLIADILGLLVMLFQKDKGKRVSFRRASRQIAMVLAVIITLYGAINATRIVETTYDVSMPELAGEMTVILIADLHLGDLQSEARIEQMVEKINQQEPDLVVMAGDIFSDDYYQLRNPERVEHSFLQIKSRYGVYASLGNHDGGQTLPQMEAFLARSNITLLKEAHDIIDERLVLLGRLDPNPIGGFGSAARKMNQDVFRDLPNDLPIMVLDHTPMNLELYDGLADIILSGHTHRGQMFPASLITDRLFNLDYGYAPAEGERPHIVVTQGVGTWMMPYRVGTVNEILTLRINQ